MPGATLKHFPLVQAPGDPEPVSPRRHRRTGGESFSDAPVILHRPDSGKCREGSRVSKWKASAHVPSIGRPHRVRLPAEGLAIRSQECKPRGIPAAPALSAKPGSFSQQYRSRFAEESLSIRRRPTHAPARRRSTHHVHPDPWQPDRLVSLATGLIASSICFCRLDRTPSLLNRSHGRPECEAEKSLFCARQTGFTGFFRIANREGQG